jgi:hypothetical protein
MDAEAVRKQQEEIAADPRAYWEKFFLSQEEKTKQLCKQATSNVALAVAQYLSALGTALSFQSKELAIFREFEYHLRNGSVTQEMLGDLTDRLDQIRNFGKSAFPSSEDLQKNSGEPATPPN